MATLTNPNGAGSMALMMYEPPVRDRRVHLDDLSGVLELGCLFAFAYALKALRRRDASLAQVTHTLSMLVLVGVGGHFLEEHVVGPARLEALLRYGFGALGGLAWVAGALWEGGASRGMREPFVHQIKRCLRAIPATTRQPSSRETRGSSFCLHALPLVSTLFGCHRFGAAGPSAFARTFMRACALSSGSQRATTRGNRAAPASSWASSARCGS